VPFMADARSPEAGAGSQPGERRHQGSSDDSLTEILERVPAALLLERIPVPVLAMTRDGTIAFANTAFAEMVGHEHDSVAGSAFPEIFHTMPAEIAALVGTDALANLVVELRHREGWTVRARMSKSLMRRDDPVALVTFENMTERLWVDER
jgi:PAS domain S-box-containing protein